MNGAGWPPRRLSLLLWAVTLALGRDYNVNTMAARQES
jgi:hypothetical protein